jgi:TRAP-type mannitol/chloroaromatic compound transport system permease small subunit
MTTKNFRIVRETFKTIGHSLNYLSLIAVFKRFGETVPRWARNVPSMAIIK